MLKDHSKLKIRGLYEHFKSTDDDPQFYVTLGVVDFDGKVWMKYIADVEHPEVAYLREINDFYSKVKLEKGKKVARFTFTAEDIISPQERDYLCDVLPEEKV